MGGNIPVGVDGAHSHPSSPPALSHEFDWSSAQGVPGGMIGGGQHGANSQGGMQFNFGGGSGMGGGGLGIAGLHGTGLPGVGDGYGAEVGGGRLPGASLPGGGGYSGLHASNSFEEQFGDQTSFIMPGNRMSGEHNSRLPGGLSPNYFLGNMGAGGTGPRQFTQSEDMGHTLNSKSFGNAFGSGYLGRGGASGQGGIAGEQIGGNAHASSHHRSDSIDNLGLDEILAMPWLGEDADGGGGVSGLGGVALATDLATDQALPEWSGTEGWSQ